MLNIDEFIKRLELILDFYNVNASAFADKIGVQRSSLSHLLSGRNKPSLEFVLKIVEVFPDVDMYWLLNGIGSFPKSNSAENVSAALETKLSQPPTSININEDDDLFSQVESDNKEEIRTSKIEIETEKIEKSIEKSDIDKIVIFYKNGTFKDYKPEN